MKLIRFHRHTIFVDIIQVRSENFKSVVALFYHSFSDLEINFEMIFYFFQQIPLIWKQISKVFLQFSDLTRTKKTKLVFVLVVSCSKVIIDLTKNTNKSPLWKISSLPPQKYRAVYHRTQIWIDFLFLLVNLM